MNRCCWVHVLKQYRNDTGDATIRYTPLPSTWTPLVTGTKLDDGLFSVNPSLFSLELR